MWGAETVGIKTGKKSLLNYNEDVPTFFLQRVELNF